MKRATACWLSRVFASARRSREMDRKACGTTGESDESDRSDELIRSITYQSDQSATRSVQHRSSLPKVVTTSRIIVLTSLNDMVDDDDERDDTVKGKEETEERIYKGLSHIDINLDDIEILSPIDISSRQVDSKSYRLQPT